MKIRGLLLKNWKNFSHVQVEVPNRLFLVGPNASGKSNFLDAFRFLRDLVVPGGGLQEAVRRRGGVGAIRCLAARQNPEVLIQVKVSGTEDWQYTIAFHQDNQRRPVLVREIVSKGGREILNRPNREDREDPARLTQTWLEQVTANKDFRELATFFAGIHYTHIVPQLIREPDRSIGRHNDPFGGDFLEQVATTRERTRAARLRRIAHALKVALPQLEAVELWRDTRGTPHLRGKYRHWRPRGAWQTEEQFSDGTLRLMGLLWALLEKSGPLLLEEPELSLHPAIVRLLPQLFARASRHTGRQVFVSTHSLDLLSDTGIGLHEVLLFKPAGEGTQVEPAASRAEIRDLLDNGVPLPEILLPYTRPENPEQLLLQLGL